MMKKMIYLLLFFGLLFFGCLGQTNNENEGTKIKASDLEIISYKWGDSGNGYPSYDLNLVIKSNGDESLYYNFFSGGDKLTYDNIISSYSEQKDTIYFENSYTAKSLDHISLCFWEFDKEYDKICVDKIIEPLKISFSFGIKEIKLSLSTENPDGIAEAKTTITNNGNVKIKLYSYGVSYFPDTWVISQFSIPWHGSITLEPGETKELTVYSSINPQGNGECYYDITGFGFAICPDMKSIYENSDTVYDDCEYTSEVRVHTDCE